MRDDGPSLTATLVAAIRATYDEMGPPLRLARDPIARELLPAPMTLLARAVARAPAIGPALHHALGAVAFGLTYGVELRTRAIDDAIAAAVGAGARQLVLLGAGLDARAYRLPGLGDVDVFEVDHPAMGRWRSARFAAAERAGRAVSPLSRKVVSVPVDFERARLDDELASAGYERDAPAFFLWEGVTMYLTPAAIRETLRAVGALAAPGSRVAVTYAPPRAPVAAWLMPLGKALAWAAREPLRGLMRPGEVAAALAHEGFDVESDESPEDWAAQHWPGRHRRIPVWERLAVARRAR